MKLRKALLAAALMVVSATVAAQNIRVFSGGASQRPDLMRKLFDEFEKKNPGTKIEMETGGATSEAQRQYLSTVLNAKDSAIDLYMIDIVNPMQYARAFHRACPRQRTRRDSAKTLDRSPCRFAPYMPPASLLPRVPAYIPA